MARDADSVAFPPRGDLASAETGGPHQGIEGGCGSPSRLVPTPQRRVQAAGEGRTRARRGHRAARRLRGGQAAQAAEEDLRLMVAVPDLVLDLVRAIPDLVLDLVPAAGRPLRWLRHLHQV